MHPVVTLTPCPALDAWTRTVTVVPTHKLRCPPALLQPGGGGVNVARVYGRLGGEAVAVFPYGGRTGEQFRELLSRESVAMTGVGVDGATRETFTVREDATGREFRFVPDGASLARADWNRCINMTLEQAPRCEAVVASGSLAPGMPLDAYAELAGFLRQLRVPLVLDTSGAALRIALQARVHLLKASLRELESVHGAPLPDMSSRVRACRHLVDGRRAAVVALSLGAEGALLVDGTGAWCAPALPVPVTSTVGAGDSFLAALLLDLLHGRPTPEALASGVAAASASLGQPGTSLARRDDVLRLRESVRVTQAGH